MRFYQAMRDMLIGAGLGIIFTGIVVMSILLAPYDREQAHNLPDNAAMGSHIK